MKKKYARRKSICVEDCVQLGQVFLTKVQISKLQELYGEDLFAFAVMLLNDKIRQNPHNSKLSNSKNHYQFFRSDGKIINFALEMLNNSSVYSSFS